MDLNWTWNILDIVIACVLAYGFIQGLRHGIIKELASIAALLIGIYAAKMFAETVAASIVKTFSWDASVSLVVAYVLVFVVVAGLVNLAAHLITKVLRYASLGWVNRLLGCCFGTLKMALIISVVLNVMTFCNIAGDASKRSVLFNPISGILSKVLPFADFELPEISLPDIDLPSLDVPDTDKSETASV